MSAPRTSLRPLSPPGSSGWSSSRAPTCLMSSPSSRARSRPCGPIASSSASIPRTQKTASGLGVRWAPRASLRSRDLIDRLGSSYWDHVVVDECHHVPATSYRDVVPRLAPQVLVGLTATPERGDGQSLLGDFEGHVAAEVRLWHALERQ